MGSKITKECLASVLDALVVKLEEETRDSEQYGDLFSKVKGDDFSYLLRDVQMKMTKIALDALQVVRDKTGKPTTAEMMDLFYALPFIAKELERIIEKEQGSACCVDKAFHVLNRMVQSGGVSSD